LHRGLAQLLPENVTNVFLAARAAIYRRRFRLQQEFYDAAQA
jgi:hypothetical protein